MTIALVEDHTMFRELLRAVCAGSGWQVVGEAGTGREAIALIQQTAPSAVLLDFELPDTDALGIIESVTAAGLHPRFLVLSSHCDEYTVYRLEKAHLHGFIDKNSTTSEALRQALAGLEQGRSFFSRAFHDAKRARLADPRNFAALLSDRELDVLCHISEGLSDDEIGRLLGISDKTVMTHRSRIMTKLGISGTPKLMRYAREKGFRPRGPAPARTPHSAGPERA